MAHEEPRFICDEMLKALGRWLRAAGYDTVICRDGLDDASILARAVAEDRVLITRDRHLTRHARARDRVVFLSANDLDACARELQRKIPVNWQYRAFTRCMECNTPLVSADETQRLRIPPGSSEIEGPVFYCPSCDKVYWDGSHVDRMRRQLADWDDAKDD